MEKKTTSIFDKFKKCLDYQVGKGLQKKWIELVDFVEGNQWAPATEKTKYMPRPVINQCDFIIENKKSNILSQNLKMVFNPAELDADKADELIKAADEYTNAAESTWYDIDQNTLNEKVVDDVLVLGTGVFHYYFDNSLTGGQFTPYIGKLRGQAIDPIDIGLGNPHLYDYETQKQPWIIIRSYPDIEEVKKKVKENGGNPEDIQLEESSTDEKYTDAQIDIKDTSKITLYTEYFKKNKEVWWRQATKDVVVTKEQTLAPEGSKKQFTLYPIEILTFKTRRKCTFGRSVIEDIIPSQRALNWQMGMMLLSIQQTAWPKLIAKLGALNQAVTNEPGEILIDHYGAAGVEGIKFMQPPNFTQMPMILTEKMLDMIRQTTGTTEVTSGEVLGANMAAAAIIALQNQAKKPNELFQNKFYKSMKNNGRIWEQFYKIFYNTPKPIQYFDISGKNQNGVFDGSKNADVELGLKVNIGPTSVFGEELQMTVLDGMADRGWIDKYAYSRYSPNNIVPAEMKHDFAKEEEILKQQQQMTSQMPQQQPQGQSQQQMQPDMATIMSKLSPEEQAILDSNPQLIDEVFKGGGANGL